MKAIINKLFAVFSAIVLVTGNCDVSYAGSHQVPDKNCSVSVNCPEYPDAYIEVTIDEETHNRAYASVYVCEQYSVVDGESKIVESRLLNHDEYDMLMSGNYRGINESIIPGNGVVFSNLTVIISIPSSSEATHTYTLNGSAVWNVLGTYGITGPDAGFDFFGFVWGGAFDYSSPYFHGLYTNGNSIPYGVASSVPQQGYVWEFYDSYGMNYMDGVATSIVLNKQTLTGGGNTTAFVAQYIHTYQSAVGGISISPAGPSYSLTLCANQWSLVASLSGFAY